MSPVVKSTVLLRGPEDWEEWYEIVRITAQARGILSLIDASAAAPELPIRPVEPLYSDVKSGATSYADLGADEKDHFKMLTTQYRLRLDQFEKQQRAQMDGLDLI